MRLEQLGWLWIGLALAVLVAATVYLWHRSRARAVDALGSSGMLERLTRVDLSGSAPRRAVLVVGALLLLALALAGPQWGAQEVEEQTSALNVILVVDVSESMWAEDVQPNRLDRARLEARRLVNELAGNRLGLVVFAGSGYQLSPLTIDHGALHLYLDALDPTVAGTPGSSPAAAIREALELLEDDRAGRGDAAIVFLSDGESHDADGDVASAAADAASRNTHIFVIGIGSERGEPIPRHDRLGERIGGFKRDGNGEVVLTRLEREPLASAARATGGFWARADEGGANRVLAELTELRRGHGRVTRGVRWTPRFQWFVAAAIALLVVDWGWAARGRR